MRCLAAALIATVATSFGTPEPVDFRYDVLPLLARAGCSSAYCHGSATGRGSFKLSLFGSDPKADHRAITLDQGTRRLDFVEVERSLLLRKPTRDIAHGGGLRLDHDSPSYRRLRSWIESGAPFRAGARTELVGLELDLVDGQLRATAWFASDGSNHDRDVTELTTFSTSDERVATVDVNGHVELTGPGEAWLFARYAGRDARHRIVRPFADVRSSRAEHLADAAWLDGLAELGLEAADSAPPSTLVRRLYLDLAGRLPTPDEVAEFTAGPQADRVATTADALLAEPEFANVFAEHLSDAFEIPRPSQELERNHARNAALRERLRRSVAGGQRLDELTAELVAPASSLVSRFGDPRDRAEFVGRAFLGLRIGCARCHDHPLDRWRRDQHLAFAALFADRRPGAAGGMVDGRLFDPKTGEAVAPRLLPIDNAEPPADADSDALLRWFVLGEHRQFARNITNRLFAVLIGRGLVEPVDDHRSSNPPRHAAMLETLTARFADGYDLRRLVRSIVTSRLYASSSEPSNEADGRYFARREARPMSTLR